MLRTAADYHYQDTLGIDVERIPVWISNPTGGPEGLPLRIFDIIYLFESILVLDHVLKGGTGYYVRLNNADLFKSEPCRIHLDVFYYKYRMYQNFVSGYLHYVFNPNGVLPTGIRTNYNIFDYFQNDEVKKLSLSESFSDHPDFANEPWKTQVASQLGIGQTHFYNVWKWMTRFKRFVSAFGIDLGSKGIKTRFVALEHTKYYDYEDQSHHSYRDIDDNYFSGKNEIKPSIFDGLYDTTTLEGLNVSIIIPPGVRSAKIRNVILQINNLSETYHHVVPVNSATYQTTFTEADLKSFAQLAGYDYNKTSVGVLLYAIDYELTYDFEAEANVGN